MNANTQTHTLEVSRIDATLVEALRIREPGLPAMGTDHVRSTLAVAGRCYPKLQVLKTVIGSVSVAMVDRLTLAQRSAKRLLHENAVLRYLAATRHSPIDIPGARHIALTVNTSARSVGVRSVLVTPLALISSAASVLRQIDRKRQP